MQVQRRLADLCLVEKKRKRRNEVVKRFWYWVFDTTVGWITFLLGISAIFFIALCLDIALGNVC